MERVLKMRSPINAKTALFGGVLAGIGASACCVGPLLLLTLGIGGAWIAHLTALEPFRPVFMVLAALFLDSPSGGCIWRRRVAPSQATALPIALAASSGRCSGYWRLSPWA